MTLGQDLAEQPFLAKSRSAANAIEKFLSAIVRIVSDRFAGPRSSLKVAVATIILSMVTTLPLYQDMAKRSRSVPGQVLSWKMEHPLSPIPAELKDPARYTGDAAGAASHADKLELRLTVPVLGRLSGTGVWTLAVWNFLAGFGTFWLLADLATETLTDSVAAALFVLGLGPTFFGGWFFNDFVFGDGVAYFFMLLSVAVRWPLLSTLSIFAAAFCDERAVTAVPLLMCFVAVRHRERRQKISTWIALAIGIFAWAGLRWWLSRTFGLSTGTTGMFSRDILRFHLGVSLPGLFLNVFRSTWTLPAFALFTLAASRRWRSAAVLAGAFCIAVLPAFLVWDFDRSVAYTFVVLLISLYAFRGDLSASRKYFAAILAINFLLSPPGRTILRIPMWLH